MQTPKFFLFSGLVLTFIVLVIPSALDSCSYGKQTPRPAATTAESGATLAVQISSSPVPPGSPASPGNFPQPQESKEAPTGRVQVTFYPTYGYQDGQTWRIHVRAWVHKTHEPIDARLTKIALLFASDPQELENFTHRITDFVALGLDAQEVHILFDKDSSSQTYQVMDQNGQPGRTVHGVLEGFVTLPQGKAAQLLVQQNSRNGRLTFRAVPGGPTGEGRVQLVQAGGNSVISDIDDTIKITQIPAGPVVVLRNTLFRPFIPVPGMAERYHNLGATSFHYVSGGPWQLYRPLALVLIGPAAFPEGSLHLNSFSMKLNDRVDAQHGKQHLIALIKKSFPQKESTRTFKLVQIRKIMNDLPQRQFIFFGDSGECDPEVYREIQHEFPTHVEKIYIRDVVHDETYNPARLAGMEPIAAEREGPERHKSAHDKKQHSCQNGPD